MQLYERGIKSFILGFFSGNYQNLSYQSKVKKKEKKSFFLIENTFFFLLKTKDFFPLILFENKVTWGHLGYVWIQGKSCAKKSQKEQINSF